MGHVACVHHSLSVSKDGAITVRQVLRIVMSNTRPLVTWLQDLFMLWVRKHLV